MMSIKKVGCDFCWGSPHKTPYCININVYYYDYFDASQCRTGAQFQFNIILIIYIFLPFVLNGIGAHTNI